MGPAKLELPSGSSWPSMMSSCLHGRHPDTMSFMLVVAFLPSASNQKEAQPFNRGVNNVRACAVLIAYDLIRKGHGRPLYDWLKATDPQCQQKIEEEEKLTMFVRRP